MGLTSAAPKNGAVAADISNGLSWGTTAHLTSEPGGELRALERAQNFAQSDSTRCWMKLRWQLTPAEMQRIENSILRALPRLQFFLPLAGWLLLALLVYRMRLIPLVSWLHLAAFAYRGWLASISNRLLLAPVAKRLRRIALVGRLMLVAIRRLFTRRILAHFQMRRRFDVYQMRSELCEATDNVEEDSQASQNYPLNKVLPSQATQIA